MSKLRVLLVDDDPCLLETLAELLEDDFDITCASSGKRALEILESEDFLVVCADFQMPGMDGIELMRQVTERPTATAGLLMTGDMDVLGRPEWLEGRTVGVVFKPCEPGQLIDNIRQLAELAQMRRRIRTAPRRKV